MSYDRVEDYEAWIDDVKSVDVVVHAAHSIDFSWKLKKDLHQPTIEIILDHELVAQRKLQFDLNRGASYSVTFVVRKDGMWDLR